MLLGMTKPNRQENWTRLGDALRLVLGRLKAQRETGATAEANGRENSRTATGGAVAALAPGLSQAGANTAAGEVPADSDRYVSGTAVKRESRFAAVWVAPRRDGRAAPGASLALAPQAPGAGHFGCR